MRIKVHTLAPVLLIVTLGLEVFFRTFYRGGDGGTLQKAVVTLIVYGLPALFYIIYKGKGYIPSLRLRMPRQSGVLLTVSACLVLVFGVLLAKTALFSLTGTIETGDFGVASAASDEPLYVLLAFIIVPAIGQELVFRGIMLAEYDTYGTMIALTASSVMGALAHLSLGGSWLYFLTGMLLGLITLVSNSLFPAIIVHCVGNFAALNYDAFLDKVLRQPQNLFFFTFLLAVIFLAGLILMLYAVENTYIRRGNDNVPMPVRDHADTLGVRTAQVFLSPTFLICAVIFVVMDILKWG